MEQKKKNDVILVQVASVMVFGTLCGLFWFMGGGSPVEEVATTEISIPEYEEEDDGKKGRMESYENAIYLEKEREKAMMAQANFNTFDFFNNDDDIEEKKEEESVDDKIAEVEAKLAGKEVDTKEEKTVETKSVSKKSSNAGSKPNDKDDRKRMIEEKRKQMLYKNKKQMFSAGVLVDDDLCIIRQLTPEEMAMGYDAFVEAEKQKELAMRQAVSAPVVEEKAKKKNGFKTMDAKASTDDKDAIRAVVIKH